MRDIAERVEYVGSRGELVAFVDALRADLLAHADAWENPTLDAYLEALAAWIRDSSGYFENLGQAAPAQPPWRHVAEMLYAARVSE